MNTHVVAIVVVIVVLAFAHDGHDSQSWTFCAMVSRLHCNERGGRRCGNDYIRRGGYTVILARIILKQESRGVGILDHIKARANDVESLLITLRKPTYHVQSVALGLCTGRRDVFAYRPLRNFVSGILSRFNSH